MTAPELWWSPSMQAENPSHGYWGLRWAYTGGRFITPDPLPTDAVRLVPAPDVAKLAEMAAVIEDAVAWTHNYDGLGDHEDWLIETARQLRWLAAPVPDNTTEEA